MRTCLKIFLQIIAWLGALIVVLSIPLAYSTSGFNVGISEYCRFLLEKNYG